MDFRNCPAREIDEPEDKSIYKCILKESKPCSGHMIILEIIIRFLEAYSQNIFIAEDVYTYVTKDTKDRRKGDLVEEWMARKKRKRNRTRAK